MSDKRNFMTKLEDGSEMYHSVDWENNSNAWFRIMAESHIAKSSLKSPYSGEPKLAKMRIYELEIKDGRLYHRYCISFSIECPKEEMNTGSFNLEMSKLLDDLPQEFHGFVQSQAHRGHSAGYEEVISIASEIVEALKPAIKEYNQRDWDTN